MVLPTTPVLSSSCKSVQCLIVIISDKIFSVGYIISAIFACAEYQRLGIHFRQYRILRASFWIKLFFILTEIALAIGE